MTATITLFGISGDILLYAVLAVAFVLFIVDIVLWFSQRESYRWYVGHPYEPEDYLLPPILGQQKFYYVDSIAASFYRLIKDGYLKVVFAKDKAIMGEMTKIKIKKVDTPSDKVLASIYELIPDLVSESGLFGETQTDTIDVDDLYSHFAKIDKRQFWEKYMQLVDDAYEEKYGKPRKSIKGITYLIGAFSVLWAGVSAYVTYLTREVNMYYVGYTVSVLLVLVGLLMFRIHYMWSPTAKKFRSRWLGFKKAVVSGNVEIDNFYDLLGYALALGIVEHYLDVVKNQIIDGKVKVGKPPFAETEKLSFSDIRALVGAVNMLAGSLGGTGKLWK
ncbi:DUF2207 domain-containing protein [bacterium 3DAC]|jgi:hypothetical protein|nr:DUF2207 domain-containing protein [Dictyoglomota bacterium]UZN22782.1 DUF2207 domain-containing protein [bacterium 3DAC]